MSTDIANRILSELDSAASEYVTARRTMDVASQEVGRRDIAIRTLLYQFYQTLTGEPELKRPAGLTDGPAGGTIGTAS